MYSVFQKCYEYELIKLNTEDKNKLFMFSNYFTDFHYTQNMNKINTIGISRHKFHIFINYYLNDTVSDEYKSSILKIFCNAQSRYMALLLFRNMLKWKLLYKNSSITSTIEFDNLDDVPENRKLRLVEDNNIYTFSIYDLIKIVNKSLSFHIELFTEVIKVKNPWTNKELPYASLLSIYHFILFNPRTMKMPTLLSRFYQANFNTKAFERNNDYIIKDSIIRSIRSEDNNEILKFIKMMLSSYNRKYPSNPILFSNDFPSNRKIEYMMPFLENFMQSKYSMDEKNKQYHKTIFLTKLFKFKKVNTLLGRSICCTSINKLFKLSLLYYHGKKLVEDYGKMINDKVPGHLTYNNVQVSISSRFTYPIPPIDMIDISNGVFWVGTKSCNEYSLFVDVNKIQKKTRNVILPDKCVQRTFKDFLKFYKFNTSQEFYLSKFLPTYVARNKEKFQKKPRYRYTNLEIGDNGAGTNDTSISLMNRLVSYESYIDRSRAPTPLLDSSDSDSDDEYSEQDTDEENHEEVTPASTSNNLDDLEVTSSDPDLANEEEEEDMPEVPLNLNSGVGEDASEEIGGLGRENEEIYEAHSRVSQEDIEYLEDDDETISVGEGDYDESFALPTEESYEPSNYYNSNQRERDVTPIDIDLESDRNPRVPGLYVMVPPPSNISSSLHDPRAEQEYMNDIFGYDSDNTDQGIPTQDHIFNLDTRRETTQENDQFTQNDFIRMQERIINSLPPATVPERNRNNNAGSVSSPIQTVFRPIDMTRVNNVTPTATTSVAHWNILDSTNQYTRRNYHYHYGQNYTSSELPIMSDHNYDEEDAGDEDHNN